MLSAGCAVNLTIAAAAVIIYGKCGYFAAANLILGIFNLLPFGYFDGGRLLELIWGGRRSFYVIKAVMLCLFGGMFIAAVISGYCANVMLAVFFCAAAAGITEKVKG